MDWDELVFLVLVCIGLQLFLLFLLPRWWKAAAVPSLLLLLIIVGYLTSSGNLAGMLSLYLAPLTAAWLLGVIGLYGIFKLAKLARRKAEHSESTRSPK